MTSYDAFFSWVLPDVPGCPEIAATQAIRDAVIEFCEKSSIHQVDHDPVLVTPGVVDYELSSPETQTRVVRVMKAWLGKSELAPAAPDLVADPTLYNQNILGQSVVGSTPKYFTQKSANEVSVFPVAVATDTLTMRVALVPTRASTGCADFLFEQWVEQISAGAIARLQLTSGRQYANPEAAGINRLEFMAGINAARQKANRGYTRADLSVRMRRV